MSDTDLCARCGGDCPMTSCPVCGGCENTGAQPCPGCQVDSPGYDDWDDEPCTHDCDEWCGEDGYGCSHQHCFNCGGCGCPGYCDDYQTYNLRPAETGGVECADGSTIVLGAATGEDQ